MIIIGEKINGAIPRVKKAIETKDESYIRSIAIRQVEEGANFIDVCAGTAPEAEVETLTWLMQTVQDAVEKPLCIDSPNVKAIERVFKYAKFPGIINSVSDEKGKCEVIFSLIQNTEWQVIALTSNDSGIPTDVHTRVAIAKKIVEKAASYNLTPNKIHLDPLIMALATDNQSLVKFLQVLSNVKELFPTIKVTSGLSNISFGMPLRSIINQNFLTIAIYAGMDSAIMDPLNKDLKANLLATEALLGKDPYCQNFSKAYRNNRIGPPKIH